MTKPDPTKGDTQKIERGPRWRDTENHFLVRWLGPTKPVLFDMNAGTPEAVTLAITPDQALNLAAWLIAITDQKPLTVMELVHHIKS